MKDAVALAPLGALFHAEARDRLRRRAASQGLDGLLLLRPSNVAYATGFYYSANERPVGFWLPVEGEPVLFIPDLERENAEAAGVADTRCYLEFPGETPPVVWMADEIGRQAVGVDALDARLLGALQGRITRLDLRDHAMEERYIKTAAELALLRTAAGFADAFLAHLLRVGGEVIAGGGTERDLLNEGLAHARGALLREHGAAFAGTPIGVGATVHSGPRAALPHGAVLDRRPRPGETVIAGIGAHLGGYHAESGATFVVGAMSAEQRRIFGVIQACNDAGVAAARPGARCEAVNEAALGAIRAAGYGDAIRHRIGHGMGLQGHEAPWLAPGDDTVIAPGMVFSNEPGIYRPGLDGYRTINTMIITDGGVEVPSRFQSNTPVDARVLAA